MNATRYLTRYAYLFRLLRIKIPGFTSHPSPYGRIMEGEKRETQKRVHVKLKSLGRCDDESHTFP